MGADELLASADCVAGQATRETAFLLRGLAAEVRRLRARPTESELVLRLLRAALPCVSRLERYRAERGCCCYGPFDPPVEVCGCGDADTGRMLEQFRYVQATLAGAGMLDAAVLHPGRVLPGVVE